MDGEGRNTPHRVLVAEFMDTEGLRALRDDFDVVYVPGLGEDRGGLLRACPGAAALVVRNRCRVDAEVLRAAGPGLRVVGRLGAGLDNVDLEACRAAAVRVVFARGANADAVCEYVFAALLLRCRRLAAAEREVRSGGWPREAFIGTELGGKTIGLLGLGEVGRRVAERARAFGLEVLGYDPGLPPDRLAAVPARIEPFEDILAAADFVSLHLPLLPETRHLIDARALARMRPGAVLVNAARGGIVDEAALLAALRAGRPGGAVLDVREAEPPPSPDPLAELPEVLLTPHLAGLTAEAQARVGCMIAAGVRAVLAGAEPAAAAV